MLIDRHTTTNIENGADGKTGTPSQDSRTTTSIENRADEKISTSLQVETTNIQSPKIGASSQVEIGNIPGFQILEIVSLKCVLPENFKIYVHWQITTLPHHHKY